VLGTNLVALATRAAGEACPWMEVALGELGQHERPGPRRNNPRIMEYLRTVGLASWDETPWCAAFVNWCVIRVGIPGTGRATARSWLGWGTALPMSEPRFGCVAVLRRGTSGNRGHVGFWVGARPGEVLLLGGSQDDSVCVKGYPTSHLLGLRWPLRPSEGVAWG
jgi:uncharacterized protein (TIGR02594 family)